MEVPLLKSTAWTSLPFGFPSLKIEHSTQELAYTGILEVGGTSGICVDAEEENNENLEEIRKVAEEYYNKHRRYLCIHLKTGTVYKNKVSIRIHGFLTELRGDALLEFGKIRLNICITAVNTANGGSVQGYTVINSELDIVSIKPAESSTSTPNPSENDGFEFEACMRNEPFIEATVEERRNYTENLFSFESNPDCYFTGTMKLILTSERRTRADQQSICDKIKDKSFHSDLTIVSNDGEKLSCHKHILAAHSPVLATMMESGFEESTTNKIEMEDMSGEGVTAFLDYLYERDVTKPMTNCQIALELFQAGHKYNVDELEGRMKKILREKPNEWFDVEVALEMFLFARNLEECDDLKLKAVQMMKPKSKDMIQSEFYQEFFKKHPLAALELSAMFLSV